MVQAVQKRMSQLPDLFATVERAEEECLSANVDENDYTVFTSQDLAFELELVVQSIAKKISFIDNQASRAKTHACQPYTDDRKLLLDRVAKHDQLDASTARTIREHFQVFR